VSFSLARGHAGCRQPLPQAASTVPDARSVPREHHDPAAFAGSVTVAVMPRSRGSDAFSPAVFQEPLVERRIVIRLGPGIVVCFRIDRELNLLHSCPFQCSDHPLGLSQGHH